MYWSENRKFLDFLPENDLLGVNLCGESIALISEALKRFPDPGSVNQGVCIEAMTNFCYNTSFSSDPGSEKRFQASGMRAIDSPHKFTPRKSFSGRKSKNFRFSLQYTHSDSLIQSQGRVRNACYRFPRIKLVLIRSILKKKIFRVKKHEKIAQFRLFIHPVYFLKWYSRHVL